MCGFFEESQESDTETLAGGLSRRVRNLGGHFESDWQVEDKGVFGRAKKERDLGLVPSERL